MEEHHRSIAFHEDSSSPDFCKRRDIMHQSPRATGHHQRLKLTPPGRKSLRGNLFEDEDPGSPLKDLDLKLSPYR